jgi:hypothetical protein
MEEAPMAAARLLLLLAVVLLLSGCEAVVSIFEAGVFIGVIGVLVILGLIAFVVSMFRR